jgi:hypothetical protein
MRKQAWAEAAGASICTLWATIPASLRWVRAATIDRETSARRGLWRCALSANPDFQDLLSSVSVVEKL